VLQNDFNREQNGYSAHASSRVPPKYSISRRGTAPADLAIKPLPASAIIAGLRVLGLQHGLPRLPDLEFAIYETKRTDKAAAAQDPRQRWRLR
jgi:hypothetical protein